MKPHLSFKWLISQDQFTFGTDGTLVAEVTELDLRLLSAVLDFTAAGAEWPLPGAEWLLKPVRVYPESLGNKCMTVSQKC